MKNFMEEKINLIWEEAPIGCAYLKINYAENGEIEDLYFLRLNSALKEMLELEEDIAGESLETLLPGISYENEKWKNHIENAGKRKNDNMFFYHSDILDKSFVVKLYSYDEEHFILYIDDITQEIKVANAGEKLLQQTGEDIDYYQIASIMCDISGARYAAFNIFAENGKEFITRALVAADSDVEKVISILGYSINNKKWSYDPLRDKIIEGKTITRFDNLSEIAGHIIPQKAVNMIERLFNTGQVYIVKIKKDGEMLGDFTFIMNKGESLIREDLVKIYAKQVGLFLDKKRAEEKLKQSQERLMLAMDAGEHCFWDWNIGTDEIYFSPGFYRMLGYKKDEISIKSFSDWAGLLHPDDYEKTVQEIKRHALKNRSYISEYRLQCSNGKYRWFSERGKNFKQPDRARKGRMVGIIIDIHNRKMKEEKIEELNKELRKEKMKALEDNQRLKILFDNLTEPIIMIDNNYKIMDINKQFEQIFKYRLDEVKGKDVFIFMDNKNSPQDRKHKEEMILKGHSVEI
ncbi:MAG: PAS domain-containing protein [Bacillota bacterium]